MGESANVNGQTKREEGHPDCRLPFSQVLPCKASEEGFTRLCNSSAKTLLTLTIPPAMWARVVIIEINSILTGKLVCFTFSALHLCSTRNLFTLCIPRWTEMCLSLPCLQKGILLLCYLLQFKLSFYTNNIIVYFSGCLLFICRI